jgi:hypothetical protein
VTNAVFKGGGNKHFPASNAPKECPLVLLAEVHMKDDKAFRSERGQAFKNWTFLEQRK